MFKNFIASSIFLLFLLGFIYPTEKENTNLFDYCFSLEKILARNTLESTNKVDGTIKKLSKGLASLGIENSRGNLTEQIINSHKKSENNLFIKVIPTKIYCLSGYWIEKFKPGTFEKIFFEKNKKVIEDSYKDIEMNFKNDVNDLIDDFNKGYKTIKKEFNNILELQ